jgi:hypothetical protein
MTLAEKHYLLAALARLQSLDNQLKKPEHKLKLHEAMDHVDAALGYKEFQRQQKERRPEL